MFRLFLMVLLSFSTSLFAQKISGIVIDEEGNPIPAVLVFNMKTEQKTYTNLNGEFTIEISQSDELRFIRKGFERSSRIVNQKDFSIPFKVMMMRVVQEIEEVKVPAVRLTGDLNKDSKNLTKFDKVAQLRAEIGVPAPPEKPREKPSEVGKNILLPLIGIPPTVNVQAIYNVLSGKAKSQKRLYKYEDLQDNIAWIRNRVDDDYFIKMEIEPQKINEFLQFSIGIKPDLNKCVKAKNVSKILLLLEETFPLYLKR